MLHVKNNYKNKYKNNLMCRACGQEEETQNHILAECLKIHTYEHSKVTQEMIFTEDTTDLKNTAQRIKETLKRLENLEAELPAWRVERLSDLRIRIQQ